MTGSARMSGVVRLLVLTVVWLSAALAFAGTRIDLNGEWQFRTDAANEGEKAGWTGAPPSSTESVQVPHTWNVGEHDDYMGHAWYFRTFRRPDILQGKHVELHFGATFYKSRVWLNGKELGAHEGGFTEYHFDVTPYLQETNYIAVQLDNRPGAATIPGLAKRLGDTAWYDWWPYGGIVRDVWLTVSDNVLVRRQAIRSKVESGRADVVDAVYLENAGRGPHPLEVVAEARSDDGQTIIATTRQKLTLKLGETSVPLRLTIANPRLWDFDHPNLYRMTITLLDGRGRVIDEQSDTFGVRTIDIRDRHLLMNGERVRLTGMTRHEESPWEGLAETRGTMLHDYNELKDLQVTLTRPVHYPQHPFILDYADRHGILLMPEIPLWQFTERQLADPKVLALAKQQMREMVEQAGNHPSIFAWSVCNESETNKPGGVAYVKAMKQLLNEIDPGRFVTYADDGLPKVVKPEENGSYYTDFIMMNQYFGTWAGPASGLAPALDKVNRDYPDKMVIISEFGAASLFAKDDAAGDKLRVRIIREQMREFAKRDWIAGAVLWCYQDYKSRRNLWAGLTKGQVPMGVVDENRRRRPSFDIWKDMNSPAVITAEFNEWWNVPTAATLTLRRRAENELPSYSLRDYRVRWEVRGENNKLLASGEQKYSELDSEKIAVEWQPSGNELELSLQVRLIRPTGFVAADRVFTWNKQNASNGNVEDVSE